jgi:signal transduction histidine kinase
MSSLAQLSVLRFYQGSALEAVMRRLSERSLWYLTSLTLLALLIVGIATTRSMAGYAESVYWVSHTHQVETTVESIRANFYSAQENCLDYVFAGHQEALQQFETAADALPAQFAQLRRLTADSPSQQSLLASLEPLINQQIAFLRTSAAMKNKGGSTELLQEFSTTGQNLSQQALSKLASLRQEEQRLLGMRTIISDRTYAAQKLVLSISFVVVLLFTILNFIELIFQLRQRQNAEQVVRRLTGKILQVQDEERRKIARDLHDGIGQTFAALKMELTQLVRSDSHSKILANAIELVDDGLNQSRTISYLLHPPMLDEVGFCAAARWLVDGFSQRSKIAVTLDTPDDLKLPRELELTLFRVLQEGLTNVHRHSGSNKAEVVVTATSRSVIMTITDHGKGIPAPVLEDFKSSKSPAGVGLAGIRGRVADLEGTLELQCPGQGTVLRVTIPRAHVSHSSQSPRTSSTAPPLEGVQPPSATAKEVRRSRYTHFRTLDRLSRSPFHPPRQ